MVFTDDIAVKHTVADDGNPVIVCKRRSMPQGKYQTQEISLAASLEALGSVLASRSLNPDLSNTIRRTGDS